MEGAIGFGGHCLSREPCVAHQRRERGRTAHLPTIPYRAAGALVAMKPNVGSGRSQLSPAVPTPRVDWLHY
jgi:hypothetical protein